MTFLYSFATMPLRKEVEKEISKINKEIANLKWSLKNEVLTQEKRAQKIQKIKDLKKTCTELTQQIEGWRVKRVSSHKAVGMYGIQNR